MISVIVPTYNQSRYLARAIESVWAQDLNDVEIVIVDDGSMDDTEAILQGLSHDGRLHYFRQENLGPAAARNRGIRESRGDLIAFLDSDDFWLPGKLKAQLDALARTGYRFSYCGSKVIDENGSPISLAPASTDDGRFVNLVWGNRIATPTVLVQRSLLDEVGLFDESLRTGEDWDLWLRLSAKSSGACITEPLVAVTGNQHWRADQNQLRAYEHSISTVIARMFDLAANQQELTPVVARKNQIASWHFSVLAKSYLHERDFRRSLRWAFRCIARSPHGLIYLMPARRYCWLTFVVSPGCPANAGSFPNAEMLRIDYSAFSELPVPISEHFRAVKHSNTPAFSKSIDISVVVPVRNEEDSVRALLEGLLSQTLPPSEIVLTDTGSIDATTEIIEEFIRRGAPVRLVRAQAGLPGRGRNLGVANSRCDWIAFTDAGNRQGPDWLARLAEKIGDGSGVDVVYGTFEPVVDSFFKECAAMAYVPPPVEIEGASVRPTSIVSALMRRSVWQAVGGFPEHLRSAEDLLFINHVAQQGFRIKRAPLAVVYWSIQPNLWRTFKRFVIYARNNIRAGLWRQWQAAIFLRYALLLVLAIPVLFFGTRWLVVPLAGGILVLAARAIKSLHANRRSYPAGLGRNTLRALALVPIIATLDAATFIGSFNWLIFDRFHLARTRNYYDSRE